MVLGFLRRESPGADELADERVIGGELLEHAVPQPVGAGVPDVADGDVARILVDEQHGHDRAHPRRGRIVERVAVDPVVGGLDQLRERLHAERGREPILERGRGETGGDLACLGTADTVGDRKERRVADERVLVVGTPATRVGERAGAARSHASTLRSVCPIRTTSPAVRSRAVVTRAPLTNVPLVEPDVLDPEAVGSRLEQRMTRGDEVVAVEPDRVLPTAAESRRHLQLDGGSDLQRWAVEHEHARHRNLDDRLVAGAQLVRLLRAEHDRLLWRRPEVARDRADDRPDEQVEEHEEADLQQEQRLLGVERSEHVRMTSG